MSLKQNLARAAYALLGYDLTQDLKRLVRRKHETFSEMDLALAYFRGRNQGVMLDVGAHYGTSLEPYVIKGWTVHAFEPDPANRAMLGRRVDLQRIRLHPFAVGNKEQEDVPFFASDESTGISSLSAFRETHQEVAKVKVSTLAKVIREEAIASVEFLKIDTEGHDLFVLRGFPWSDLKPELILCEFEDAKTLPLGYDYRSMGDYLVEQGYSVFLSEWYPILKYGVEHRWKNWKPYPCSLDDSKAWGNFAAFRERPLSDRVTGYLARMTQS